MLSEQLSLRILKKLGLLESTDADPYMVSCPFHKDSNPSCSIHIREGYYNCFSCGRAGPLTKLYKELTHHSIKEDFPDFLWETALFHKASFKEDYDALPKATFAIKGMMIPAKEDATVMAYLHKRGITDKVIEEMGMKAGVNLFTYDTSKSLDDRRYLSYRDRVIIPIIEKNELLAIEGRYVLGQEYWESHFPNSKFRKAIYPEGGRSSTLFGINELNTSEPLYICEGTMDLAILRDSKAMKNSSCVFGANIGPRQLHLLKRFPEVIYITDNDKAGLESFDKLYHKFKDSDYKGILKRLPVPDKIKDIGDLPKINLTVDDLIERRWLQNAQDYDTFISQVFGKLREQDWRIK